jgi:hypothetical protein
MLSVKSDSMMRPGTMKAPYATPSTSVMREPIAEPNTTKYSDVVITGVTRLCHTVRIARAISNL